jgi:diguanylate cyclase (GGDEF)-like protein
MLTNHAVITDRSGNQISIEDSATPVKNSDGITTGVVSIFRDITQRKAQAEKIEFLSYHDHLTGLYNRRYFEEELKRIDGRRHYPLSIVMGDINSLKMINDAFGHLAGDGIIYATGKVIKKCCRPTDHATRWGGDEFVLLLPNTDGETAKKIVERMNQAAALASVDQGVLSIAFGWDTKYAVTENIMTVFKNAEGRMYKQKLKMKPEVREMTIATIMNTLFEKSGSEKNHAKNVSFYCQRIAEAMHLSEQEIEIMKTASYLHDIGKVAIDKKVLEKADCLSDEEWELIKRHPEIGYHITNTSADQSEIALAILGHHEWWDGNGYPKGLSGTDIPLLSRIIAIACAYDTILTKRPDKKPGNSRAAVNEIMAGAGSQFEPEIAILFVNQVVNTLATE